MKWMCLFLSFCMVLCGCQTAVPAETECDPGSISDFTFSLPEGCTLEADEENSLHILKNGEIIGGLVLTGLDTACLEDTGDAGVHKYINSYGPMPLICEYLIMQADGFLSISLAVTDPDTDVRTESSHRLFAYESRCFDLWFHQETDDDTCAAIFQAIRGTE